jgi:hypothetical protein
VSSPFRASVSLVEIVATFDPPGALARLEDWKAAHRETIDSLPEEAILFDVGRAKTGTFARVRVNSEYMYLFRADSPQPG